MDQTTTTIIGLCSVGFATWVMLCWSASRFFRIFVVVSVVAHAGLFFVPFATSKTEPRDVAVERLLPLTLIQGADEGSDVAEATPIAAIVETTGDDAATTPFTVAPDPQQPEPPGDVDVGLPKIKPVELFTFDEHPDGASYRRELQHTILRYFEVPPELEAAGYEGRVKVWITLGRDGTVRAVELDPTMRSVDAHINQLTLDNIWKMSGKIPPLPSNIKDAIVPFNVIIDYRIFRNR